MSNKNIPHLLDEPPILVYPSLAKALKNVNKAIILQQLHFLLNMAKLTNNRYVEVDGKWWVYNSYKEWKSKHFTWLAEVTIKGLFGMLESDGLIISRQGVKDSFDRKKWYTINYDSYLSYISSIGQNLSDVHEIKNISWDEQNLSDDNRKSETPNSEKREERETRSRATPPIPDTSIHPLIQTWASIRGIDCVNIGAPVFTSKDVTLARKMAKWEKPPTEDEIKQAIKLSKAKEYAFRFLEEDIPKLRLASKAVQPESPDLPRHLRKRPIELIGVTHMDGEELHFADDPPLQLPPVIKTGVLTGDDISPELRAIGITEIWR